MARRSAAGKNVTFARRVITWQRKQGRHDLPWQGTRDPYAIWLSEIMLQQTQVAAVVPYYERFRARFPTLDALAAASMDDVLQLWSGLGYYARARSLHRAAVAVVEQHAGSFPRTRESIERLPGVGRSTAGAIAAFAFGRREAILDGNVKRVFARHFAIDGFSGEREVEQRLWALAESLLPAAGIEAYTQGLMDLGATLCTRTKPACQVCPVNATCAAHASNRVDAYPAPRPRRAVPQRHTTMLVLLAGGEVMLEKRPPSGIWGGLWCFPELGDAKSLARICRTRYACEPGSRRRLPLVRHGFTHFALDIDPVVIEVRRSAHRAAEPGIVWLPLEEARRAALPVPAKKILAGLLAQQAVLFEEVLEDL
jgi:A/G-specific adenine glycosylase